jgi:hypothetical protein
MKQRKEIFEHDRRMGQKSERDAHTWVLCKLSALLCDVNQCHVVHGDSVVAVPGAIGVYEHKGECEHRIDW